MTASISRDDFVAQANAICAEGTEEIEGSSVRPGTRQFSVEVVVPNIRQQLADIRELGFPEGDEETIEGRSSLTRRRFSIRPSRTSRAWDPTRSST